MIIIFEGPDGAGKSTAAKEIASRLGHVFEYVKHSYTKSPQEALESAFRALDKCSRDKNYIFDRFYYPSDQIYGPVAGGYTVPDRILRSYKERVLKRLIDHDVLFIYMTATMEQLRIRSAAWADDYVKIEQLATICDRYEDFFALGPVPADRVHKVDTTTQDAKATTDAIYMYIKQEVLPRCKQP